MLRVAGGALRGRKLHVPEGTRPTLDKVRQAIFNMLQPLPEGGEALDGFAGSGALGIEALSRGFAHATFVENARASLLALRRNIDELGLHAQATILAAPWAAALLELRRRGRPFDLVLLDPPYALDPGPFPSACLEAGLLAPGGALVIESASRGPSVQAAGDLALSSRRHGDTMLWVLRRRR